MNLITIGLNRSGTTYVSGTLPIILNIGSTYNILLLNEVFNPNAPGIIEKSRGELTFFSGFKNKDYKYYDWLFSQLLTEKRPWSANIHYTSYLYIKKFLKFTNKESYNKLFNEAFTVKIIRKDVEDWVLSVLIADSLKIFNLKPHQQLPTDLPKVTVDYKFLNDSLHSYFNFLKYYDTVNANREITYEDLTSDIRKDFSSFTNVNLEGAKIEPHTKKLFSKKEKINFIENYGQVKKIIDTFVY